MKNRIAILLAVFCMIAISALSGTKVLAATDTKKPTIRVSLETEEVTADTVKMTVTVKDNVGVAEFRYAGGKRNTAYFRDQGKGKAATLKNGTRTFNIKKNGTYTFYAVDAAGNTRIKQIVVSNLDLEAPALDITAPDVAGYTKKNQYFTLSASDDKAGVDEVKYAYGKRDAAYFGTKGTVIHLEKDGSARAVIKKNSTFTFYARDKAGHETTYVTQISFMDKTAPACSPEYTVSRQTAEIKPHAKDDLSGVKEVRYLYGTETDPAADAWKDAQVVAGDTVSVTADGIYSFRVTDQAGNRSVQQLDVQIEFRAVWFTYIEFAPGYKYNSYTFNEFKKKVDTMFDQCVSDHMTAVIVQVRPFSDALYQSAYFPWSGYVSGEQGKDPGFDPMGYMVEAAHERGLEFHAYLNPYRVETVKNYSLLSDDNPAKKWLSDDNPQNDRNVLRFNNQYYYNPAVEEVQELIVNGVREIVENYDVDGIHFDDYFYPTLGDKYKKNFDYVEYNDYASIMDASGLEAKGIADWRRDNVSNLVKKVYAAVKKADPSVVFGISPAGNLANLRSDKQYYVDVDRWLSEDGFIDYICPQIYWGFENKTCPFAETVDRWIEVTKNPKVNLYVGLAGHYAGTNTTSEWESNTNILSKQVKYLRNTNFADGFFFYRYDFLTASRSQKEVQTLRKLLD